MHLCREIFYCPSHERIQAFDKAKEPLEIDKAKEPLEIYISMELCKIDGDTCLIAATQFFLYLQSWLVCDLYLS